MIAIYLNVEQFIATANEELGHNTLFAISVRTSTTVGVVLQDADHLQPRCSFLGSSCEHLSNIPGHDAPI
jgi:hypothetical protein